MPAPARIDWAAARAAYMALDPPRSFGAVARMFGISDVAVGRRAKLDGWVAAAAELDRKAGQQLERKIVRDRAQRLADRHRLVDELLTSALDQAYTRALEVRAGDVPALIKIEQLLDGEATERIDISQVRHVFALFISGARPLVDDERWPAFVAMLERTAETLALNPPTDALGSGS